jgi:hypothetical protein
MTCHWTRRAKWPLLPPKRPNVCEPLGILLQCHPSGRQTAALTGPRRLPGQGGIEPVAPRLAAMVKFFLPVQPRSAVAESPSTNAPTSNRGRLLRASQSAASKQGPASRQERKRWRLARNHCCAGPKSAAADIVKGDRVAFGPTSASPRYSPSVCQPIRGYFGMPPAAGSGFGASRQLIIR